VTGYEVGARRACADPERDAGAVEGRLGELRPVRDSLEGVLAHLALRVLDQIRQDLGDGVAHVTGLAALSGK
jgi:hypothetical protein